MELGKNATDDLCNSSKWPFWQANVRIHLILVCWDARNTLLYNLVIPFKDGVTFAVTTATQSLQRFDLENVADLTYVAVSKYYFLSKISKFWIENAHASGPEAIGGHRGSKRRSKTWFYDTQTTKNHRSLQQCNLEIGSDITYVAVTKCHFLQQFFKILN